MAADHKLAALNKLFSMGVPAAVDSVTSAGVGKLAYHQTLTLFLPDGACMHAEEARAIGFWLTRKRKEIQEYLDDVYVPKSAWKRHDEFTGSGTRIVGVQADQPIERDDDEVEAKVDTGPTPVAAAFASIVAGVTPSEIGRASP